MSDNKALVQKILQLKKKKNAAIVAHNYQIPEIQDLADFVGDSLELSKTSMTLKTDFIVFCGVRFMAETAKILSPDKKVLLPVREAGCPLADTITTAELLSLKKQYPDAWVVSYVNTPASIKALTDVCCTSSNAIAVVKNVPSKEIIFVPDKNLGWWVQKNVPEKRVIIWQGSCFVHEQFNVKELAEAKKKHPDAEVLVHPECTREVIEAADQALSTAGMLKYVKQALGKEFIIGTEEGILHKLKKENPGKEFYSLGMAKTCINMKKTTLVALYDSLRLDQFEITLERDIIEKAKVSLERMVQYL